MVLSSPVRGGRGVVLLGDLRAIANLGEELLLGQEVVRHLRLQHPNLVEQQQLCTGVVAVVADHGAYHGPVLLGPSACPSALRA